MKHISTTQANVMVQRKIGKRIRAIRKEKGLSQTAFAPVCGIHESHLSKVERGGGNPTLSVIVSIAKALEITLSDLFHDIPVSDLSDELRPGVQQPAQPEPTRSAEH